MENLDDKARQKYEAQSQELRIHLKQWETDWAAKHGGKKPGRDDIKQNAEIGG